MTDAIRAEIEVGAPGSCPVASASAEAGATVSNVVRSSTASAQGMVTEEFELDADASVGHSGFEPVFESDARDVYRFEHEHERGCLCECVERHGCPIVDRHAHNGTLTVTFHASDLETLQAVVDDLQDWFDDVHVRQLTRSGGQADSDVVFVDRERLTDRQREVLETSYEMGYFEHPKRANGAEVADALDIAPATFSELLAAAQAKLLEAIVDY